MVLYWNEKLSSISNKTRFNPAKPRHAAGFFYGMYFLAPYEGVVKGWIVFPGKAKMRAEAQFTRSK